MLYYGRNPATGEGLAAINAPLTVLAGGEMQWEIVLAASVLVTFPMLILFFLGQRYFMEGIATTASVLVIR